VKSVTEVALTTLDPLVSISRKLAQKCLCVC